MFLVFAPAFVFMLITSLFDVNGDGNSGIVTTLCEGLPTLIGRRCAEAGSVSPPILH